MITLTHPETDISLVRFNLKHKINESGYSSVLTATIITSIDDLFLDDAIQMYNGDTLVFDGSLTDIKDGQLTATSQNSLPSGSISSSKIIFYNKDTIRVALDFDILSNMDFTTNTHSIITDEITHYNNFSEILI